MDRDIQILHAPVVPIGGGGALIYSITLTNGYVITSPAGFGDVPAPSEPTATPRPLPQHA